MKVLQVISSFPPAYSYGGPLQITHAASKELARRGHKITVFTTDVYDPHSRLAFTHNPVYTEGVKVYHFRNLSNTLAHKNLPIAPTMAFALRQHIESFDLVHVHEYFSFQAALVHHYAIRAGTPYILQAHGSLPRLSRVHAVKTGLLSRNYPKKIFDLLVGYSMLKDATKIIATSRVESDQFADVLPDFPLDKVVHLPNCVDLRMFECLPASGQFRRKWNIDKNTKIVLFLSRVHERKGADLLVAAFSRLRRTVDFPLCLVIIGPDEGYLQKLKSLAKRLGVANAVIFTGRLIEPEKLWAYVDADVFVLPSKDRYESFGNVVLEALGCGTPVIVTNNCGVSEWIGRDVGYIINYDETELCNALHSILKNDPLCRTLGNNGRKLVKNEFGCDRAVSELEKLYEVIVSKNDTENNAGG